MYTRHKPLLADMLDQLMREKLSETDFPYCGEFRLADRSAVGFPPLHNDDFILYMCRTRPQDVIVFMVGGATYAEALVVANTNKSNPGVRIVLGGSTIHNSKRWVWPGYSLSLSLSLSHTHTHTHTLSLSLPVFLRRFRAVPTHSVEEEEHLHRLAHLLQ